MSKTSGKKLKSPFLSYVLSENRVFLIYAVFCFSAFALFFLYSAFMGDGFYRFSLFKLCDDTFMDFYNSARDAHMLDIRCYTESHVIYPPLANLFYAIFGRFLSSSFLVEGSNHSLYWTKSLYSIFSFVFFTMTVVAIIALVINNRVKGSSSRKFTFAILSITCWPFAYMVERGNILILAYLFLLIYIFYMDSESKVKREIAIVALALSAGIKLYPAVFGLLLLLKKRYKEAVRAIIYGILSVVIPLFAFYGGIDGLKSWMTNVMWFSGSKSVDIYFPGSTTLKCGFYVLQRLLGDGSIGVNAFGNFLLTYVPLILMLAAVVILPKKWQKLMALVVLSITVPGGGGSYSLVFLIIPLIYMMEDTTLRVFDYIYVFIITFQHMYFPIPMLSAQSIINLNQAITAVTVFSLFFFVFIDLCLEIYKIIKRQRHIVALWDE